MREGGGGGVVWIWGLPLKIFPRAPKIVWAVLDLRIYRNYMSFHVKITLTEKPKKKLDWSISCNITINRTLHKRMKKLDLPMYI